MAKKRTKNRTMRIPAFLQNVEEEISRSRKMHGFFQSPHEAIAVIREEYLELEREVFHGTPEKAMTEAIQLAAMAVRFAAEFSIRKPESKKLNGPDHCPQQYGDRY